MHPGSIGMEFKRYRGVKSPSDFEYSLAENIRKVSARYLDANLEHALNYVCFDFSTSQVALQKKLDMMQDF